MTAYLSYPLVFQESLYWLELEDLLEARVELVQRCLLELKEALVEAEPLEVMAAMSLEPAAAAEPEV